MPRVSAWFIRASLCHLVAGFAIGAVLLSSKGLSIAMGVWVLRAVHIEMLLVGWIIQLVMGVAIWIFPRVGLRRAPRRSVVLAWVAFGLLNSGVLLASLRGVPFAVGRLVEVAAAGSFVAHLWGRVTPGLSEI